MELRARWITYLRYHVFIVLAVNRCPYDTIKSHSSYIAIHATRTPDWCYALYRSVSVIRRLSVTILLSMFKYRQYRPILLQQRGWITSRSLRVIVRYFDGPGITVIKTLLIADETPHTNQSLSYYFRVPVYNTLETERSLPCCFVISLFLPIHVNDHLQTRSQQRFYLGISTICFKPAQQL